MHNQPGITYKRECMLYAIFILHELLLTDKLEHSVSLRL